MNIQEKLDFIEDYRNSLKLLNHKNNLIEIKILPETFNKRRMVNTKEALHGTKEKFRC